MKITLASVLVDDQDKALQFYTEVLGFTKKTEVPLGAHRWLTVVSAEDPDGVELVLEPDDHPAAKPFKDALVEDGIPFTSFAVEDVQREYDRLSALGVRFTQPPLSTGPVTTAVLDDTCGNLIQIAAVPSEERRAEPRLRLRTAKVVCVAKRRMRWSRHLESSGAPCPST